MLLQPIVARATPVRVLLAVRQVTASPAPRLAAVARATGAAVRAAWRTEWSLASSAVAAFVLSAVVAPWTGWVPDAPRYHAGEVAWMWVIGLLFTMVVADQRRRRPRGPLTTARAWWRASGGGAHAVRALLALGSLSLVVSTFSGWKNLIGRDTPFFADPWLHAADVALHGGRTPADWLAAVITHPGALHALDWWYYVGWTTVSYVVGALIAWAPANRTRTRLLLTSALSWLLLGTAAACMLASAGPCFFGRVVPGLDPYAWQTATLGRVPGLTVTQVQATLWTFFQHGRPADAVGGGISAMPSLHVASAAITVVAARRYGGRVAVAAALLMLSATMLGSVALGMHYAVDGYASLLGVAAIWWLTGRLAPRPLAV